MYSSRNRRTSGLLEKAFITCSIQSDGGTTFFNLTSEYDFVPPTAQFPTGHYSTQVGLYSVIGKTKRPRQVSGGVNRCCEISYLESQLYSGLKAFSSQYWAYLSSEMQTIRGETNNNLRKGTIRRFLPLLFEMADH